MVPGHTVVIPGGGTFFLLRGCETFSAIVAGQVRCIRGLSAMRVEQKALGLRMVLVRSEWVACRFFGGRECHM